MLERDCNLLLERPLAHLGLGQVLVRVEDVENSVFPDDFFRWPRLVVVEKQDLEET